MSTCSGCGGSHASTPAPAATTTPAEPETCTDLSKCDNWCNPRTWVSCEEQNALIRCAKQILCDFLRCLERDLFVDGKIVFDSGKLWGCVGSAVQTSLICIPDALCPRPLLPPAKPDDLPCDFAVEETAK